MDKIEIIGGKKLEGKVRVSGAKNAVLPVMAACLLAPGRSIIHNVPRLRDVDNMLGILRHLGARGEFIAEHSLALDCERLATSSAPYDLVRKMRASVLVLGALLGRLGRAEVSVPGGCVIGSRPIDLHLKGLRGLTARVEIEHGYIKASAKELRGGEIYLGGRFGSSVGATINLLLAAVKAHGRTVIINAACEPEVVDLAGFLQTMGASVSGAGSPRIIVEGKRELAPAEYAVIPDRIEAGTYLIAGAVAGRKVILENAVPEHLSALIEKLSECGGRVERAEEGLVVRGGGDLLPVDITTLPYPGFPTDMQAQVMVLLSRISGISLITEKVYPERFMHVPELIRLGARISLEGATAIIRGPSALSGAPVMAADLRASAALVLAALAAEGKTVVDRVYHLDRGYERMVEKLSALGAKIRRIK
jgi:UDP-N-acetylglucosamine 1-carboxyvinyltransferase